MKNTFSIPLKAAFLLIVFSLNTFIGVACSVGMNMGFNSAHHFDPSHHRQNVAVNIHQPSQNDKGNCCKDEVVKFAQVDKLLPSSANSTVHPVFFTAFIASFYSTDALASYTVTANSRYFVRSHHPPIPDIRIAIQSFQI